MNVMDTISEITELFIHQNLKKILRETANR